MAGLLTAGLRINQKIAFAVSDSINDEFLSKIDSTNSETFSGRTFERLKIVINASPKTFNKGDIFTGSSDYIKDNNGYIDKNKTYRFEAVFKSAAVMHPFNFDSDGVIRSIAIDFDIIKLTDAVVTDVEKEPNPLTVGMTFRYHAVGNIDGGSIVTSSKIIEEHSRQKTKDDSTEYPDYFIPVHHFVLREGALAKGVREDGHLIESMTNKSPVNLSTPQPSAPYNQTGYSGGLKRSNKKTLNKKRKMLKKSKKSKSRKYKKRSTK
jgi:hypothetical protein